MAHKLRPLSPGFYRTVEGQEVIITKVIGMRAYGRMIDSRDTTWWYSDSGEHGLYTPDDLTERLNDQ